MAPAHTSQPVASVCMNRTILAHFSGGAVVKMMLNVSGEGFILLRTASLTDGSYAAVSMEHMEIGSSSNKTCF